MGDWRPLTILILIIAIPIAIWGWGQQYKDGYLSGDAAFFDGYPNLQDFLEHRQQDSEGYADYWGEGHSFWYEQGFEEGYKKAAKTYWNYEEEEGVIYQQGFNDGARVTKNKLGRVK
jgi:hypothetical protein